MNKILIILLIFLIIILILNIFKNKIKSKKYNFQCALEDMDDILKLKNIDYFLFCGTALGAYRERDFISHDIDIDLGVYCDISEIIKKLNDNNKFKLLRTYPKNSNDIKTKKTEVCYLHLKTNVRIDIFKVEMINNKKIHYSYESLCNRKENKRCEFINNFNLTKIDFLGRKYNIPTIDFLISHYGDDWKIPKKFSYSNGLKNNHYMSLK